MYNIIPAQSFERNAKPLLKKYPSLRDELFELGEQLAQNPTQGTPLGKSCYKLPSRAKRRVKVEVQGSLRT